MNKLTRIFFCFAVFAFLWIPGIDAETVPYQFSLFSPLQTSPTVASVKGLRINLISGVNNDVTGLDAGMINLTDGHQTGLQFGFYNRSFKTTGIQIGLFNKTSYLNGLQIGFLNIHEEGDLSILPGINFAF